jgi:hypothetical protein
VPASSFAEQPARQCVRSRCRSIEDCAQTDPSRAGISLPILKTGAWHASKYSTAQSAPAERKRYWDQAVSQTYFPLELGFRSTPSFAGDLEVWSLGNLSISRNVSDGLVYRRHQRHVLHDREQSYLITVPELSEISFAQDGTEVRCRQIAMGLSVEPAANDTISLHPAYWRAMSNNSAIFKTPCPRASMPEIPKRLRQFVSL